MTVHNFSDSLAKSQAQAEALWWEDVYRRAFADFDTMTCVRNDGWAQRGGIDRVVNLTSGKTINIDEKVRDGDWPDILLERWSNRVAKTPGWVQKALATDFIAYAFVPTQRCYLLPFLTLRKAWQRNGRDWIAKAEAKQDGFSVVLANNGTYTTESVAVPIGELLSALSDAMVIEWRAAA